MQSAQKSGQHSAPQSVSVSMQSAAGTCTSQPLPETQSAPAALNINNTQCPDAHQANCSKRQQIGTSHLHGQEHQHQLVAQQNDLGDAAQHCHASCQQDGLSQQEQQGRLNGNVDLSCSLDEDLMPEVDTEITSRLQPCLADDADAMQDGLKSDSSAQTCPTPEQNSMRDSALPGMASLQLSIKTSRDEQAAYSDTAAPLQHEMAVSPSAQHHRRKQARLDSKRCIKF